MALPRDRVVCGAHCYAESTAVIGGPPPKHAVIALHNYQAFPTSLNTAISLPDTWNLPRVSIGDIAKWAGVHLLGRIGPIAASQLCKAPTACFGGEPMPAAADSA